MPKPIAKAGAWVEDKLPLPEKPFIKPWMIDRADDNFELDGAKARRLLGWSPQHTLRETLPMMLEGLKVDPEKWYKINKLHWTGNHHADSKSEHVVAAEADPIHAIEHQSNAEMLDPPGPTPALSATPPRHDEADAR